VSVAADNWEESAAPCDELLNILGRKDWQLIA